MFYTAMEMAMEKAEVALGQEVKKPMRDYVYMNLFQAGTWRLHNVVSTSMQRHDFASTLRRRCIDVMCLLGKASDEINQWQILAFFFL